MSPAARVAIPRTAAGIQRELAEHGIEVDASEHRLQEYSYDASNYRVRPAAVVFPTTTAELTHILQAAQVADLPITPRGGGTSMAGNAIGDGVVVDFSRWMTEIDDIDLESSSVWVDAGVVMGELRQHVERQTSGAFTFAPDPSSLSRATIGGAIGNDACGNHSVKYGRMSHHIEELEILTVDGARLVASAGGLRAADTENAHSVSRAAELSEALEDLASANFAALRLELETIPRQVSGYQLGNLLPERGFNIARALAGSEGTCVFILRARVKLVPTPGPTALLCLGYDTVVDSARDVGAMLEMRPSAIEGLNSSIVDIMRHRRGADSVSSLPSGDAYVMVEFSAQTLEAAEERCRHLADRLRAAGLVRDFVIASDPHERAKLWRIREDGAGLSSQRLDGTQTWPGWEDSAVDPLHLAEYLAELLPVIEQFGYTASMYGHFGAGCVHMRLDFDLRSDEGRARFDDFMQQAADIVVKHGGSLSGEHGDGRARSALLNRMYSGQVISMFRAFKNVWDPKNLLNPGIIVDPAPYADDLALAGLPEPKPSASDPPSTTAVHIGSPGHQPAFAGPAHGQGRLLATFVGNAQSCIGVGRCRATAGNFMCPSFRATKDEKDSTRGRARVLQELARGQGHSRGGWAKPEVREALDLCLSCKACSTDCPTGVDIAEAKSELIQDHYRKRIRPFTHYSIGWLPRWLPLMTRFSALANASVNIGALRWLIDKLGISAKRRLPAFASQQKLKAQMREAAFSAQPDLLVFVDSFTKAFRPEIIPSAANVLRSSGAEVGCTPDACCGLTWISTGQRDAAARRLAGLVRKLDDGTNRDIVVLEPSCAAAIRDDGPKLVGGAAAQRVADRVRSFSVAVDEAMDRGWVPDAEPPSSATLQTHCHEHAEFGPQAQRRVLSRWGVPEVIESSSCCGVAGNFGFETEHFALSMNVAEHSIIPALERGGPNSLILTDGFSCSMQVSQIDPTLRSQHLATALDGRRRDG